MNPRAPTARSVYAGCSRGLFSELGRLLLDLLTLLLNVVRRPFNLARGLTGDVGESVRTPMHVLVDECCRPGCCFGE